MKIFGYFAILSLAQVNSYFKDTIDFKILKKFSFSFKDTIVNLKILK